ncbi:MAG: hypothetical protein PVS2B2_20410 [Candidatus Acidiferrum sp.]
MNPPQPTPRAFIPVCRCATGNPSLRTHEWVHIAPDRLGPGSLSLNTLIAAKLFLKGPKAR